MTSPINRFIEMANPLIAELERAISNQDPRYRGNAEIALSNVRRWRDLGVEGRLPGAYRPNFGISKSDLMFGPAEDAMYDLEALYVNEILPMSGAL